jgi:hypothetical protein
MPDPASGGQAPPRAVAARVISRVQRAVLGALMSLAVIVLERRLRAAFRSGARSDTARRPSATAGDSGT